MALRQPDDQIIAVEVVVKGDTAHDAGVHAE
jgi:6,7-dimethyl-8-ribityllumazine synthase